ncbi:hypothetical protein [Treponema pedis]|uniref:hypothetical protein n=1 Tax=Treponema pedis TaxID=409322 RepID=UPI00041DFBFC|nr:hypothetical protein [Treponema pedis]
MDINKYWHAIVKQDAALIKPFFVPAARIRWHNTGEQFTVDEFIKVNCEYPDKWAGSIERIETLGSLIITVVHVFATNKPLSFHVTSFIQLQNDKIISVDEYWGEDGEIPQWRRDKKIGSMIKPKIK